jgi:hypothetical protein
MRISHALGVGVRALVQQHLGYVQVISERGRMQGGPAVTGTKPLKLLALVSARQNRTLFSRQRRHHVRAAAELFQRDPPPQQHAALLLRS